MLTWSRIRENQTVVAETNVQDGIGARIAASFASYVRQLAHQEANEIHGAYTHADESWQERSADDAVEGGRVRPAKGARSCHENECLRKSAFKWGCSPEVARPLVRHVGVKERQK